MIKNVICRGYGPGASIAFVVTRGYSIGSAVVVDFDYWLESVQVWQSEMVVGQVWQPGMVAGQVEVS